MNAEIVAKSKTRADIVVKSVAKPILKNEFPHEPTKQEATLTRLEQTDVDGAEYTIESSDWTMDIGISIPRGGMRSRSNSVASESSEPPPPPASQFVGSWEPEQAQIILERVDKSSKLPYMVALIGTPGSGKSISSFLLASILEDHGYPTMICPHDGTKLLFLRVALNHLLHFVLIPYVILFHFFRLSLSFGLFEDFSRRR